MFSNKPCQFDFPLKNLGNKMFSFLQMSPERLNLAPEGAAHLKAGLFHGICHLGTRAWDGGKGKVNSCPDLALALNCLT